MKLRGLILTLGLVAGVFETWHLCVMFQYIWAVLCFLFTAFVGVHWADWIVNG